jgi:hypothetical protein
LVPTVWVKSDRPGLQLMVRVVMPRSIDPRTGRALTTLVRGSSYAKVGAWEQLRLDNLVPTLKSQVRVLRAEIGRDVDEREAYVDRVLINVYGGPGLTNVNIDDLEIAGAVPPQTALVSATTQVPQAAPVTHSQSLPVTWADGKSVPKIERSGSILTVGNEPFLLRAIEYQGESPARLKEMGFNAAWLSRAPTARLLRDAAAAGLWIIAPPPSPEQLETMSAATANSLGGELDAVLAWDLGRGLPAGATLDATRRWAKLLQAADARGRPLVCEPDAALQDYTRPPVNIMVARREVLGTSLEIPQYVTWLRHRTQLAMPGTILWTTIQTQPPASLLEQCNVLSSGQASRIEIQESQLRALVHAAMAGGARGLIFQSTSSLERDDSATKRRRTLLQLINLELDLIERWPAAGNFANTADSSDADAKGAVIETDRSRLLLPMYVPPRSQLVIGASSGAVVNYVVPGVPEEANAYELSLVSCRPLASKRVAGGTRVLLSELERDSLVVFTQDHVLLAKLNAQLKKNRQQAAQLSRQLAAEDQVSVEVVGQRLAALGHDIVATRPLRIAAQEDLREFDALAAKNDLPGAYYKSRHALAVSRIIQRAHFDDAIKGVPSPLGDPWLASHGGLDEHFRLATLLTSAQRGPNLLPTGGCENLQQMMVAGWKHHQHKQDNVVTAVDLSPQVAHAGGGGLRLKAAAMLADNKPTAIESAPMWVTTPPIPVEAGQWLEIQGWARIAEPIAGSVDGLLIIDSLTGPSLAQRITTPGEWQPFTIYRGVPQSGTLTVTFALSGLGEVWLDDVIIRPILHPGTAPPPQQAQQFQAPAVSLNGLRR